MRRGILKFAVFAVFLGVLGGLYWASQKYGLLEDSPLGQDLRCEKLEKGMSEADVHRVLGRPNATEDSEDGKIYFLRWFSENPADGDTVVEIDAAKNTILRARCPSGHRQF